MSMSLSHNMVHSPYSVEPSLEVEAALKMMRAFKIRHFPVIAKGRLVGLVSERDLLAATQLPQADRLLIEDVMKREVYAVLKDTPLKTVVRDMAERKIGSAVVVNARNAVVGIFTTIDALVLLAEMLDDDVSDALLLHEDFFDSWEERGDDLIPLAAVRGW